MELHELTIHAAHDLLKKKEVSAIELTRAVLDRVADLDEKVIGDLAGDIETILEDKLESVINYVENKVYEVIEEFRCMTVDGVCQ